MIFEKQVRFAHRWKKTVLKLAFVVAFVSACLFVLFPAFGSNNSASENINNSENKDHVLTKRKVEPRLVFSSQSNEDLALYDRYYKNMPEYKGVIVEIGALDGVTLSISKFFEEQLGWHAILIEANPKSYIELVKNRPLAKTVHAAACKSGDTIDYVPPPPGRDKGVGGAWETMTEWHKTHWIGPNVKPTPVDCIPLSQILVPHKKIDIFVLDVEGGEVAVLETMDWEIEVDHWIVEMNYHVKELKKIFNEHGYYKTENWNIRDYCVKGGACPKNVVFERRQKQLSV